MIYVYRTLVRNPEGRDHFGDLDIRTWEDDIKLILKKYHFRLWNEFMRLRTGTNGGLY
jgi:hypothetical protein